MKKRMMSGMFVMMVLCCLTGCGKRVGNPGTPPEDVLLPEAAPAASDSGTDEYPATGMETDSMESEGNDEESETGILENAVSVKIGLVDNTSYAVDMQNNEAANTMLGYLSSSEMRFPTYTYDETEGYVAQNIRGDYTRDDEAEINNISAGDLYLFSGGQLRLYFKDIEGADITATYVGRFKDGEAVKVAVPSAYEENRGDTWNVDVYFLIKRN